MRSTVTRSNPPKSDDTMHTATALLSAIDSGQVVEIVGPESPEFWLCCAELAVLAGNADEALEDIRRAGEMSPALRLRARCIEAELAIESGDAASGEVRALDVLSESIATGDRTAAVRARLAVTRAKVRAGSYRLALGDLPRLRREIDLDDEATPEQSVFRRAICDHLEAYSRLKLGDSEAALAGAHRAIAEFVRIGATRWEGWSRGIIGLALLEQGQYDVALREFERSETCAAALGMQSSMLMARSNAAIVCLAMGDPSAAVNALRGSLAFDTGTVADVQCRMLLSVAFRTLDRSTEARSCAREAVKRADELGHEETGGDARILVAWLDGERDKVENLRRRADNLGRPFQVRMCLVALADLEPASRPDQALALLELADEFTGRPDELSEISRRIRARLAIAPIRYEGDALVIDLSHGIPHLDDAVEAVQRMLVNRSMRTGEDVQARAARELGISKTRLLALRRKLGMAEPKSTE